MKYTVDYKQSNKVENYSLCDGIIYDCLLDQTPFGEMVYIIPFLIDENKNFINTDIIKFNTAIICFNIKKGFIIETIDDIYNIYDNNNNIIAKNLIYKRTFPLIDINGKILEK